MNNFELISPNKPSGDQPKAIKQLVEGLKQNKKHQVLLGVTGSGKTFTAASVINEINKPALIISHNKTLASQLYSEFKELFPNNSVEYFVSYFDYYQPEAYLPKKDLYIEKSSANNKQLAAMRMSAINSLLTRRDTIVVASVAAIYGEFNPSEYEKNFLTIKQNQKVKRDEIISALVKMGYTRHFGEINRGDFTVKGDLIEVCPGYNLDYNIRITFFDDEIDQISFVDPLTKDVFKKLPALVVFPATTYTLSGLDRFEMCNMIEEELNGVIADFKANNKLLEAQRISDRVYNDIDSIKEFGYVNGMENYARYVDGRQPGERPYTLFDYLPKDAVIFVDESHLMIPQIRGMFNGDRARKESLVNYGFRLPSCLDNRPLMFHEYESFKNNKIYMSATPAEYELEKANNEVIRQIIRPTGLVDPIIEIETKEGQIQRIYDHIKKQIDKNERTLILTTTKASAEELSLYLQEHKIKSAYIHESFKIFERNEILKGLRTGKFDVVIGINLLREGIDLPEVSLICVLDADQRGFSRNTTSLIQIVGRAARNDHGKVIFYADEITEAMKKTIEDNKYKREIQTKYNLENNIVPKTIIKPVAPPIQNWDSIDEDEYLLEKAKVKNNKKLVKKLIESMQDYAKDNKYEEAIKIRDYLYEIGVDLDNLDKYK
ncbi:excinuclease ABC subunit UvrB [[Mycoplasma] falconis]|uniref:UvrABC system protein B n=1 Tax=[Mycoplasma] falconis TaxID=92403 RepID=A0A501XB32_9BACT|nr:excinuclease ABC subunit UvrB [[Mycoplasma] falconis]TPE57761.1 excinuclease ABC subunit UvrB [[Mycoplasma] falconis]